MTYVYRVRRLPVGARRLAGRGRDLRPARPGRRDHQGAGPEHVLRDPHPRGGRHQHLHDRRDRRRLRLPLLQPRRRRAARSPPPSAWARCPAACWARGSRDRVQARSLKVLMAVVLLVVGGAHGAGGTVSDEPRLDARHRGGATRRPADQRRAAAGRPPARRVRALLTRRHRAAACSRPSRASWWSRSTCSARRDWRLRRDLRVDPGRAALQPLRRLGACSPARP